MNALDLYEAAMFFDDLNKLAAKTANGFVDVSTIKVDASDDERFYDERILTIANPDGSIDVVNDYLLEDDGVDVISTYDEMFEAMYGMSVKVKMNPKPYVSIIPKQDDVHLYMEITVFDGKWFTA